MEQRTYLVEDDKQLNSKEHVLLKRLIPLISTLIIFAVGIWFFRSSIGMDLRSRLVIGLISFFPVAISLIVTIISVFKSKSAKQRTGMALAALAVLVALALYYVSVTIPVALMEADNPVTDSKYYEYKVNDSELLRAFPKEIPEDAKDVRFLYQPGALQGGTTIEICYVDENMTREKFDSMYKDRAKWTGRYEEYSEIDGLLGTAFEGDFKGRDHTIYLIEAEGDDSGYNNHGRYLLAAFDENTKEAVYKYEKW